MKIISKFQNGFPENLEDDPNEKSFWYFFFSVLPRLDISRTPWNGKKITLTFLFWGWTFDILED